MLRCAQHDTSCVDALLPLLEITQLVKP